MSAYSDAVLADSPLLYLRLDETSGTSCANSGSLGGSATITGTVTRNVTAAHANLGVAVNVQGDADDDYISYPDTAALDLVGDFTYEIWFKSTTFAAGAHLMTKGRDNSSTIGYRLYFPGSPAGRQIELLAGTATILTVSSAYPNDGAWHHVAVTRAGNLYTLYVDGASVGSTTTAAGNPAATTRAFHIGIMRTEFGVQNGYAGALDEVAVYSTALSSGRVAAHYAAYNAAAAAVTGSAALTAVATIGGTGVRATGTFTHIKFGTGLTVTDEGGGVIRVDVDA